MKKVKFRCRAAGNCGWYLVLPALFFFVSGSFFPLAAQPYPAQAFENVTLHHADGSVVSGAAIVWRQGKIEASGRDVDIPFDARVYDGGDSLHIYPGFIDGLAFWGSPELPANQDRPAHPGEPGYERAGIQTDRVPADLLLRDSDEYSAARDAGFKTAAVGLKGRMLPGQVDVFIVRDMNTPDYLLQRRIAQLSQFVTASGAYPSTLMGMMAAFRQLWLRAETLRGHQQLYAENPDHYSFPGHDAVLEAFYPLMNRDIPVYFAADEREDIERVLQLQDELGFDLVLVSGRQAYTMVDELARREIPILVSIDLPEKPEWLNEDHSNKQDHGENQAEEATEATEAEEEISPEEERFRQRQLEAYQEHVNNIRSLMEAGLRVGFASCGMDLARFHDHIKTLMEYGLTKERLMSMLTVNTAEIIGLSDRIGTLEAGQIASFSVYSTGFPENEDNDRWKMEYSVSAGQILKK